MFSIFDWIFFSVFSCFNVNDFPLVINLFLFKGSRTGTSLILVGTGFQSIIFSSTFLSLMCSLMYLYKYSVSSLWSSQLFSVLVDSKANLVLLNGGSSLGSSLLLSSFEWSSRDWISVTTSSTCWCYWLCSLAVLSETLRKSRWDIISIRNTGNI